MQSKRKPTQEIGKLLEKNIAANDAMYETKLEGSKANSTQSEFRTKKVGEGIRVYAVPNLFPENHAKPIADFRDGLAHELSVPADVLWIQLVRSYNYRLYNFKEQEYQLESRILADLVHLSGGEITYVSVDKLISEVAADIEHTEVIKSIRAA